MINTTGKLASFCDFLRAPARSTPVRAPSAPLLRTGPDPVETRPGSMPDVDQSTELTRNVERPIETTGTPSLLAYNMAWPLNRFRRQSRGRTESHEGRAGGCSWSKRPTVADASLVCSLRSRPDGPCGQAAGRAARLAGNERRIHGPRSRDSGPDRPSRGCCRTGAWRGARPSAGLVEDGLNPDRFA